MGISGNVFGTLLRHSGTPARFFFFFANDQIHHENRVFSFLVWFGSSGVFVRLFALSSGFFPGTCLEVWSMLVFCRQGYSRVFLSLQEYFRGIYLFFRLPVCFRSIQFFWSCRIFPGHFFNLPRSFLETPWTPSGKMFFFSGNFALSVPETAKFFPIPRTPGPLFFVGTP